MTHITRPRGLLGEGDVRAGLNTTGISGEAGSESVGPHLPSGPVSWLRGVSPQLQLPQAEARPGVRKCQVVPGPWNLSALSASGAGG